jgi:hypothetical protein
MAQDRDQTGDKNEKTGQKKQHDNVQGGGGGNAGGGGVSKEAARDRRQDRNEQGRDKS